MSQNARTALVQAGLRYTDDRAAVFSVLQRSRAPLAASDIAKNRLARNVDKVTVYRTLETFQKAGLARRTDLQRGRAYFELAANGADHHHLVCVRCEKITDIEGCDYQTLKSKALRRSGFAAVTGHSLELFGVCGPCARKERVYS